MKIKKLLVLLTVFTLLTGVPPSGAQDDETITYYVTDDAAFGITLLEDWVATGSREIGLYVASSEATLDLMINDEDTAMPSGEFGIFLFAGPMEDTAEWDVVDFVNEIVQSANNSETSAEWGETSTVDYRDRTYGRVDGTSENTDITMFAYEITINIWGLGFVFAAPGESDSIQDLGLALLDSTAYSLPLDDTIKGFFGNNYLVPAGWVGGEFEGIFDIANSDEAREAEDLDSGQFKILLMEWDGADADETANSILEDSLDEGEYSRPPVYLTVGEQEVLLVAVRDEDDLGIGGILVLPGIGGVPDLVVIYASAPGESYLLGLTALNVLLNSQVSAETE